MEGWRDGWSILAFGVSISFIFISAAGIVDGEPVCFAEHKDFFPTFSLSSFSRIEIRKYARILGTSGNKVHAREPNTADELQTGRCNSHQRTRNIFHVCRKAFPRSSSGGETKLH